MKLTLYRPNEVTQVGQLACLNHDGIRPANDLDSFEFIAKFYGVEILHSNNIEICDLVVFNLHRSNIYTNLNPSLLVNETIWKQCKQLDIPVVFWHSGECHQNVTAPWFSFAKQHIGQLPYYVDSNANIVNNNHLFFDSSEIFVKKSDQSDMFTASRISTEIKYKLCLFTHRSEPHKHVVYNHIKDKYTNDAYCHYSNPLDISNDIRYKTFLNKHSFNKVPNKSNWVSNQTVRSIKDSSSIIVTLNSYFIKSFTDSGFEPLYITEKFLLDLITNKPIIPIGHPGTVRYLQNLGFEFPKWIDYRYDEVVDDNDRLSRILLTIDNLFKLKNLKDLSLEFQRNTVNAHVASTISFKNNFLEILNKILDKNA